MTWTEPTLFDPDHAKRALRVITKPVLAIDTRDNAGLMLDCRRLGYLDGTVLDLTVGPEAGFWARWRPDTLVTNDLDLDIPADHHHDARAVPFPDNAFDSVVFDPPYKLNGPSRGTGPAASDRRYGVDGGYVSPRVKIALLLDGTAEAIRLARRYVLVKCQDQQSCSRYWPQTFLVWQREHELGAELVDLLHVPGERAQPLDRGQRHARRNYSSLVVLVVPR